MVTDKQVQRLWLLMNKYNQEIAAMKSDPAFGEMLISSKGFLNGLSERCSQSGKFSGVGILHHDRASYHMELKKNAQYNELIQDGYVWGDLLQ